jgi:hypothetical protein
MEGAMEGIVGPITEEEVAMEVMGAIADPTMEAMAVAGMVVEFH